MELEKEEEDDDQLEYFQIEIIQRLFNELLN